MKKDGKSRLFSCVILRFERDSGYCDTIDLHLDCNVASAIFEQREGSFFACASSKTFLARAFSASFTHAARTVGSVTEEQAEALPVFDAVATAWSFKQYWRLVQVRPVQVPSSPESAPVVPFAALRFIHASHSFFNTGFVTFRQDATSVSLPVRTSERMS